MARKRNQDASGEIDGEPEDVRSDKLEDLKRRIASGEYDSDEKIDSILESFLNSMTH